LDSPTRHMIGEYGPLIRALRWVDLPVDAIRRLIAAPQQARDLLTRHRPTSVLVPVQARIVGPSERVRGQPGPPTSGSLAFARALSGAVGKGAPGSTTSRL
jgi:hypothetical protein